ncbi:MAG: penicillin-binding protein 2 [Sporichthyaceae bacterium]
MNQSTVGPGATSRRRIRLVQGVGMALMLVLAGRLWHLQVASADAYAAAASENTVREVVVPAPRGLILDAQGRPLVRNRNQIEVTVDRSVVARQPDRGTQVLTRLAGVLDVDVAEVTARIRPCAAGVPRPCWNGSPYVPVPVAIDVPPATALEILERRELFSGVEATPVSVRSYPSPAGANAAHLLGYLQPADVGELAAQRAIEVNQVRLGAANLVGRAGLERQYDGLLRGTPGITRVEVDRRGRVISSLAQTPPIPGDTLVTTLDAKLQAIAERELAAAIQRARTEPDFRDRTYPADSGALVVLDVRTGAVLAMASAPTYDPRLWVGGITERDYARLTAESAATPLLSRALGAASPPASTMKVASVAAAAAAGYDLDGRYPCPRSYNVGGQEFKNFEDQAYGFITLARALEVSCDTVFYKIAHELWLRDGGSTPVANPADPLQAAAAQFGLGRPTGIDLPGEIGGRIADREFKQSYWEATREATCARAEQGYAELRRTDPKRADYLHALDIENCVDGHAMRAGDMVNFSIGQGDTLVTPLQLARMYAAIANGGTLWRPQLAKAQLRPDGDLVRTFDPVSDGRVGVPAKVLRYLRQALVGVSAKGTAAGVFAGFPLAQIPVGAKTGTAEKFGEPPSSWFAGLAPAKPGGTTRYAIVMTVNRGGTGSATSGPGVRSIVEALVGVDRPPVMPGGLPPARLPVARTDGTFGRPR